MTATLIRKLLRDVRLALIIVALLLGAFQCLWAKITDRIIPLDSLVPDGLEPLDGHVVLGKVLVRIQEAPSGISD